jgi:putative flippase GtrA
LRAIIPKKFKRHQIVEVWNYYKIGVINTLFGFSLYSFLVFVGINLFVAQIIGQIIGMIFNYFTYSRHVFSTYEKSVSRYVGAYTINYMIGVALLFGVHSFIKSPYIAGITTTIILSGINFFLLKGLAFRKMKR